MHILVESANTSENILCKLVSLKTRSLKIVRVTMSALSNAKRHNIFQWRPTVGEIRGRGIAQPPTTPSARGL